MLLLAPFGRSAAINEKAKNKMLEYFTCFPGHYTTTATSREVPDRETGNF